MVVFVGIGDVGPVIGLGEDIPGLGVGKGLVDNVLGHVVGMDDREPGGGVIIDIIGHGAVKMIEKDNFALGRVLGDFREGGVVRELDPGQKACTGIIRV